MRKLALLSFIIVTFISRISASDVLEYTDGNFNSEIINHDIALVEFYAPWYKFLLIKILFICFINFLKVID